MVALGLFACDEHRLRKIMMTKFLKNTQLMLVGIGYGMLLTMPAVADDIEIYTSAGTTTPSTQANVLFVLDTSGSMIADVPTRAPYDVTKDYSGGAGCYLNDHVYSIIPGYSLTFSSNGGKTNAEILCGFSTADFQNYVNKVKRDKVECAAAASFGVSGFYTGRVSQYRNGNWRNDISPTDENDSVECEADSGVHGENTGDAAVWAKNGQKWSANSAGSIDWGTVGVSTTLLTGRYLNYIINEPIVSSQTRMQVMQDVMEDLVNSTSGINIGLMRFSRNGNGGMVVMPVGDIDKDVAGVKVNRKLFIDEVNNMTPKGNTPLSESFYEAAMYYQGKAVDYGLNSTDESGSHPSVSSSTIGGAGVTYKTPIINECQKNYVLLLTDGDPVGDVLNATRRGKVSVTGCGDSANNCLDEIATSIGTNDQNSTLDGDQVISTFTIGFANSNPILLKTANASFAATESGERYLANDAVSLADKLNEFIGNVYDTDTTFSAPAVSVNAFNRSVHIEDLYFTLFKPTNTEHWPGNFKKYKLAFEVDKDDLDGDGDKTDFYPIIADLNGDNAVDPTTGFFIDSAVSYWSGDPDGKNIREGGAAAELDPATREVVTYTGGYLNTAGVFKPSSTAAATLKATFNKVDKTNAALTNALFGLGLTPASKVGTTPLRETLIDWTKGIDVLDIDGDSSVVDARNDMGAPLHSQPALVQYGETSGNPDLVAYVATNDGYLHAFDVKDGSELFSFIPQELLPNLNGLMDNDAGVKYGLDGDVVAWIDDKNGDGTITGSDRVYLYIGMRRGGKNIYSIDVTNRNNPKLRWVIKGGFGDYAELGETWSAVNVEKIKDGSGEKTVLIFGGGYDDNQDDVTVRTKDNVGRAVFMADAESGELLWSATASGTTDVEKDMEYSIPARIKPLDINDDGYIDRLYAVDMGGQILRFDIDEKKSSFGATSMSGGRIADLAGSSEADARRFYYPPDVALVAARGKSAYLALALTSGYRAHPLDTKIQDRIYMLKEADIYHKSTGYTTVTESDLFDTTKNLIAGDGSNAENLAATTSLDSRQGWFIKLDDQTNTDTWVGEKGLAEPLLINGVMIATTFTPKTASSSSCGPQSGSGRVYFIDILDGSAAYPGDTDKRSDRHKDLAKNGIPPSPNVIVTKTGQPPTGCIGLECGDWGLGLGTRKTYWYEEN